MINFSTLILSSEVNGPGGLFDIDATLPLVAIQFLLLMVILNIVLYNPLLTIIEERKEYILTNLGKASELLAQANNLTAQYEEELTSVRKEAQLEITNSQKIHQEILDLEINISQKYLDNLLDTITNDFESRKTSALNNLEESVQSLCNDINTRLSI
jgi:F-type H+-transporting ATPase subunit b